MKMNLKSDLRRLAVAIAAALVCVAGASAQTTAADAFKTAPRKVFPLLENDTRLDMLDYYNSGMSTASTNVLKGKSRITAQTPEMLEISMTDASTYHLVVLPAHSGSVVALITTVATPAPDSKMTVYTADWTANVTAGVFEKPQLRDWLTAEGRKNLDEVEMTVPFLLIGYKLDPATGVLTMTNNTEQFMSEEMYDIVRPYLLASLSYRWNGKKFEKVK